MNTVRVMSKNAAYQKFEVLRTNRNKRYRYGEFLVEGVRNINQASAMAGSLQAFYTAPKRPSPAGRRRCWIPFPAIRIISCPPILCRS